MDDLISRQAAIDALYHHFSRMSREECAMILHEVPSAELANKSPKLDSKNGELISRQEALKCFAEYSDAWCAIHSLPYSVRRKGKWIEEPDRNYRWHCSECGEWYVMPIGLTNYCPNCGAEMG